MAKRSTTTKEISLLYQLYLGDQLELAPEFQRNSVWPPAAKAYFIDTLLKDKPIPLLFFQRNISPQTGKTIYSVIDGQQRLRAIFEFLGDDLRLTESMKSPYYRKKFSQLSPRQKEQLLGYDLPFEDLTGYKTKEIVDIFVRMNRYVVTLSRQELRHAREEGIFKLYVEKLGALGFWAKYRIFSNLQMRRMRHIEFSAELVVLLNEGPQDKKKTIDLYYQKYKRGFPNGRQIQTYVKEYFSWIVRAIPDLGNSRYRRPVDLYSLIGALHQSRLQGHSLSRLNAAKTGRRLGQFEEQTRMKEPTGEAAKYLFATSRSTDNIGPRSTRISIIRSIVLGI